MNVCSRSAAGSLAGAILGAAALQVCAGGLQPQGAEFQLTRGMLGDQVNPSIVLHERGGLLVWQDAAADGDGLGIAAVRIAAGGSGPLGAVFRVNDTASGDQENASVATLPGGAAIVVWQGGPQGFQRIFARIVPSAGTPAGPDIQVSTGDGETHADPVATTLADGNVVVAWSALRQDGSFSYDVYARRFTPAGASLGDEFRLNANSGMNRRSPTLAALSDGAFLAGWVSERQVGLRENVGPAGSSLANGGGIPKYEVALTVRRFGPDGQAVGSEQRVSDPEAVAAHPALAALPDGRAIIAWTRRDPLIAGNRYDVASRLLSGSGTALGEVELVNVMTYGDQFRPRFAVGTHGALAIWSSMGQDGSWEGVFGRWIGEDGKPSGDEVPINGQTGGGQILPAVAAGPDSSLLVAWSSNLPRTGYEIFAQRLSLLLLRAEAAGPGMLRLRWPTVAGGVYRLQSSVDGSTWADVAGNRTASGTDDSAELAASGRVVFYRVLRAR